MKIFLIAAFLPLLLLSACKQKVAANPAHGAKRVPASASNSEQNDPGKEETAMPSTMTAAPSASSAGGASTLPADPNDIAEIQRRFLQTVNDAIKKAEVGLKTPVAKVIANQTFTYYAEYTGKFTYDIKKTDSIVSPLLGTVSWSVNWYENGIPTNIPMTIDARYGYQDGRWVIRDLHRRINDEKNVPADEYFPFFQ